METAEIVRTEDEAASLRAEQGAAFVADDLERYFELSDALAAAAPGYARSYEYWVQTVLHALARDVPDPVFLQVGAMDGKRYDPIYAFAKHYRWHGLIMEPLPDLFGALAAHYAGRPEVTLVNAALTESDGTGEMVRVKREAVREGDVPLWAEGLGSFFPERNALGGVGVSPDLHAAILDASERTPVSCLTFASLAERYGLDRIDLLQVDAEGCELDIWRQVDAAGVRPRVVHLEYWALPPQQQGALIGSLAERGYRLRMSESDVMALAPELMGRIDADAGWAA